MNKGLIIVLMAGLLVGGAYGKEEVYYCGDIDGNGFKYNKESGKYERSGFFTEKFKLKLNTDTNHIDLAFDERKESYVCMIPYSLRPELMSCVGYAYQFNFNTNTGRFVYSKGYGYVAKDGDSIGVSYGTCDQF